MVKRKAQGITVRKETGGSSGSKKKSEALVAAADPVATAAEEAAPVRPLHKKRRKQTKPPTAEENSQCGIDLVQAVSSATAGVAVDGRSAGEPPSWSPLETQAAQLAATEVLAWLLWPVTPSQFFSEYWEKRPLHVRRGKPAHFSNLFSKADIDQHLARGVEFKYGERINLARFDSATKRKVDLNSGPRGAAAAACDVASAWAGGATLQVMHPQQFHDPVWKLLAGLERAFGAIFGANSYLTPNDNQGLAPHFDDVEVFMLQLEGSKCWRLHAPPVGEEHPLPRDYSRDFLPEELGALLLECTLEPGDLLYLPRGTVHSGVATMKEGKHTCGFSHHLTVSTYQKTAWCHLLERALPSALERAASQHAEFRAGLPVGFLGYMGTWHDGISGDEATAGRAGFMRRFKSLLRSLLDYVDADEVCDELGVDFMSLRMPPCCAGAGNMAPMASAFTATGDGTNETEKSKLLEAKLRWLEPSAIRAMMSTDPDSSEPTVMLFHAHTNSREQHMCQSVEPEEDVGCLRFDAALFLPAIKKLFYAGREFVGCSDLPLQDDDDKVSFVDHLREAGLLELRS